VSELISATSVTWDAQLLDTHFIAMDKEVIMNIPLSTKVQDDFWSWHYEKTGVFTVRSAYRMLMGIKKQREDWFDHRSEGSNNSGEQKSWTKLWKVQVPSKIRVFAWRLAKMSLPDVRLRRNMATENICSVCNVAEDSWRHSLLDCNMARSVWSLVDEELTEHMTMNQTGDARLWLFWLFDTLNKHDLITSSKPFVYYKLCE
jgi:hypothetical protein